MAEVRGAGAPLGPRLLGRLTAEVVLRSAQYMNCVGEYEIDLRANRITAIENLGATEASALPEACPCAPVVFQPYCVNWAPMLGAEPV